VAGALFAASASALKYTKGLLGIMRTSGQRGVREEIALGGDARGAPFVPDEKSPAGGCAPLCAACIGWLVKRGGTSARKIGEHRRTREMLIPLLGGR